MVISMERWRGKVAIVTGASGGIGAAIAEQLVEEGLKVVGLARRKERIEELAKKLERKPGKLYAFKTDLRKEEDIIEAFEWTKKNIGPIYILINNAAIATATKLIGGNTKFWKDILDTNVLGLCIATREAIKDMQLNNVSGHIVHINSVAGHVVPDFPNMSVYPASKYAVTALTESLRLELNAIGSRIKISSVSPGIVATEMFEASAKASGKPGISPKGAAYIKALPTLQPKDLADAVLYVLATPPHVQIHELKIKPIGEPFQ